ncbi:MAG: Ig-like domain-containing protein [Spirochaetia bacterium]
MERRIMVALLKACGAALLAFGFLVCSNPIDIVNTVKTEVMVANNKFLVIKASGPFAANDQNVNPNTTLWIQFDRDLDASSVTAQRVTFAPSATWTPSYNAATKTLTITPSFLESTVPYTVTIGGLKGTDGSDLQTSFVVAFKTRQGPAGSMAINSGLAYTNISAATLYFSVNAATTQVRWSFTESDLTPNPNDAHSTLWQMKSPSFPQNLGVDGPKTVYYQLYDGTNTSAGYDVGAGTHPLSASTVVDTVAPVVGLFSINNGDMTTPTIAVTLYNNASDPTSPVEMHFQNGSGSWSNWEDYSATKAWYVSSPGTRLVTAEFRDKAGNVSTTKPSDAIIVGTPTLRAYMNNHANGATVGNTYEFWSLAAPDVGTDTYHILRRLHNDTTWIEVEAVSSVTSAVVPTPQGVIYDWAVQITNSAISSAISPYSNIVSNFTSDIVVVYNEKDSADTSLAQHIQGVLTDPSWITTNSIKGVLPTWSVTLVPQGFITTKYSPYNQVWGYPVIATRGVTLWESVDWDMNLVGVGKYPGRGLIAMGTGGANMLLMINKNWGYFELKEQQPGDLGYAKLAEKDEGVVALTKANPTVWALPLYFETILNGKSYPIGNALPIWSITKLSATSYPFCSDAATPEFFNTVQQGRFVLYGFDGLAGDGAPRYMWPFWVNLVNQMSDSYYP